MRAEDTAIYKRFKECYDAHGKKPVQMFASHEEVQEYYDVLMDRMTTHGVSEECSDDTPLKLFGVPLLIASGVPWTHGYVRFKARRHPTQEKLMHKVPEPPKLSFEASYTQLLQDLCSTGLSDDEAQLVVEAGRRNPGWYFESEYNICRRVWEFCLCAADGHVLHGWEQDAALKETELPKLPPVNVSAVGMPRTLEEAAKRFGYDCRIEVTVDSVTNAERWTAYNSDESVLATWEISDAERRELTREELIHKADEVTAPLKDHHKRDDEVREMAEALLAGAAPKPRRIPTAPCRWCGREVPTGPAMLDGLCGGCWNEQRQELTQISPEIKLEGASWDTSDKAPRHKEQGPGIAERFGDDIKPEPISPAAFSPRYCGKCGHSRGCMCPREDKYREPRVIHCPDWGKARNRM
jgi:hypothetical protein